MAEAGQTVGRPMKYPYTWSAKIAQFPYKHYFTKQWIWKYWAVGAVLTFPIFVYIHNLANSPENVRNAAEAKRKEMAEHKH